MAESESTSSAQGERLNLREHAWPVYKGSQLVALVGFVWALSLIFMENRGMHRFLFAYLGGYFFFLTIVLGALFFVLIQHVTRAGWSVNVRRIAECIAATMPVMAVLAAPIAIAALLGNGELYSWANPRTHEELSPFKQIYLTPVFFVARLVVYFAVWSGLGLWYWRQSVKQDQTGDPRITIRLQALAAPSLVLYAFTLTAAAFDMLMSLDPEWTSTIFGVYIFAGCVIAIHAVLVLSVLLLQKRGFLRQSVTVEHFHDLGKFLFAFVFFWGYIAFSQYMLQWYGNMPEETHWYLRRGATTAGGAANGWSVVILLLLFGHVLIPFGGLLSRHVKRNLNALAFWSVWMLVFHWVDLFWLVRPEMGSGFDIDFMDLAVLMGVGGIFMAVLLRRAAHESLRPLMDPRLADSLAFENI